MNLTHGEAQENFPLRYGDEQERWRDLLSDFTPDDLRRWAAEIGTETYVGTSGRVIDPHSLGLGLPAELGGDDTQDFFAARERLLAVWERAFLVQLLDATEGNVSEAARRAGIDRGHLHRLIKKYDIPSRR